jgi:hypothetical protein
MSISASKNIGAFIHAAFAAPVDSVTATGSALATISGVAIDRFAVASGAGSAGPLPLSCSVLYSITATLASTHTMSLAYSIQDSADGTNFANMLEQSGDVVAATVELTGNVGGTAQNLLVKQDVDLTGAREYVRVYFTPSFSASSVDTAVISPVIVFGGMNILP